MSHTDLHFHRRADDDPVPVDALPPGMTMEQLDFFTEQTERAVEKGVKEGVRQYRNRAVQGFVLLLVGLMVLTYFQADAADDQKQARDDQQAALVASGRAVAVDGCNRDFVTAQSFRATITRLKEATQGRADQAPAATEEAVKFYQSVLDISPLPDCRDAENVITDNPEAPVLNVQPYYPGADYAPKAPELEG